MTYLAKMDMRWHRAKLTVVRNRIMIIWASVFALWVFSFVLGFIVLARLNNVISRVEEGQQGQNCILLIKPSQRTQTNLTDCINKNRAPGETQFKFHPPSPTDSDTSTSTAKPSATPTPQNSISLTPHVNLASPQLIEPIKVTPSTPVSTPTIAVTTPVATIIVPSLCPITRPIIYLTIAGIAKYQCTGDNFWQTL